MTRALSAVVALALLAACSKPAVPDKDKPVEPQAAERHDELSREIHKPIDRAHNVQADAEAASKAQDAEIEAATSGQ
ncbi:hypothetical protein DWG18_14620 [Lysobacter sp. TY2-98]|uniref:hypothetical protein n=1 Tax=Lysobacter sp. TY2-98 TaxID=2290922 RepID=UPI000E20B418|nr:hypothetical protein [Lysobacter sp. TY2-98]AXK73392.1 hypothetical protein DWG18_14620 [Lysobacter sp. TY2-98]